MKSYLSLSLRSIGIAASLALVALLAPSARADDTAPFVRYTVGDYVFSPARASGKTIGFLGWPTSGTTVNGISYVWVQPSSDGTTYTSYAWDASTKSLGDAANWVTAQLGGAWAFGTDGTLAEAAAAADGNTIDDPEEVKNGLYVSDVFADFVDSLSNEDKVPVVETLSASGWPASPRLAIKCTVTVGTGATYDKMLVGDALDFLDIAYEGSGEAQANFQTCTVPSCPGCTCVFSAVTATAPATWTVTSNTVGARKKCTYRRAATATQACTGQTLIGCNSCATTCGTTTSGEEVAFEDVLATDPCGTAPPAGAIINFNPASPCL
jgi:hypothetical protein